MSQTEKKANTDVTILDKKTIINMLQALEGIKKKLLQVLKTE